MWRWRSDDPDALHELLHHLRGRWEPPLVLAPKPRERTLVLLSFKTKDDFSSNNNL